MAVIETQGFKLDNSGRRIVVDPVTRIEGHLRIEVNLDDKNVIRNAVSTGTMWRGLEVKAATRATPGLLSNASAVFARACTRWCRCARWKTR
jgi:coenzyme F420-reducing hydrogenase alpha subunit